MSRTEVDEATLAEIAKACDVPPSKIEDIYVCVHQQLDQINHKRSERFQIILYCGPEIDADRWCAALRHVVAENPVMRTRIVQCRLGFVQVVTSEDHVTERLSGDLEQYLRDDEARRLDFGVPLLRSAFIDRMFVLTIHHAIMDYWSATNIFREDLVLTYFGHPAQKRPAFKEFVAHCVNIDELAAKSFWASRFKRVPAIFPRVDPGYTPYPTQEITKEIALKRMGNGVSSTHVPSFTEAAWALTAATYADSESVAYGFVLSGRSPALNGVEQTLGPTHAEVPVQVNLQRNMTVEQLVRDRATSLRQLQAHPALQYGLPRIAVVSEAARAASGFQTLLNIIPALPTVLPAAAARSSVVRFDRLVWRAGGSVGLWLRCRILDDGILVEARYDRTVLVESQVHRVLNQFEHTIQTLTEVPLHTRLDKLPLLSSYDRSEILLWNKSIPETAEKCLHEMFVAQARVQPEAVAVEASDGSARYQELDRMSDRLAHELLKRGVFPGNPVAFIMEKSLWAIVTVLAIMKVGGVCVPINKDDPYDLKAAIISGSNAKIVLTSSIQHASSVGLASDVFSISGKSIAGLTEIAGPLENGTSSSLEGLAYIIPTSGITGVPKGVMLEHRCLVSSLTSLAPRLGWQPGRRMLQFANYASNISICEIFGALLSGGCLCIPSEEVLESNLAGYMESTKVNWALLAPSVLRNMSPSDVPSLQSLLSTGEPVGIEASKTWGEALRFFNSWGACEASILSTVAELKPSSPYPESIGMPVGCAVWVVNPQNTDELAPIDSVGELLIEGPGVAGGYLNDGAKISASFISQAPLWASSCGRKAARFFRTGDLGKYNPDGSISFVGKQDNRVKLNGQTVQLEDIESVLNSCDGIRDVVTLTKISAGRTQLVAVVSLADPRLSGTAVLQGLPDAYAEVADQYVNAIHLYAESTLPVDKLPTIWHIVQRLPRTVSGKLDRLATRRWLKTLRN